MPILLRVVGSAGDLPHPLADGDAGSVAAHLGGPGELILAFGLPRLLSLADRCFARVIEIVMTVEDAWHSRLATVEAASHD